MPRRIKTFLRCGSAQCAGREDGPTILAELADEGHAFDPAQMDVWNPDHPASILFHPDRDTPNAMVPDDARDGELRWARGEATFEYHAERADFRIRCGECKRVWVVGFDELREWLGDDVVLGVHVGRAIGT